MRWTPTVHRTAFAATGSAPSLGTVAPNVGRRPKAVTPKQVAGTSASADAHKRALDWQTELWERAEDVGELGFIITFFENCGRRCRLVAAWRDSGGGTPTEISGVDPRELATATVLVEGEDGDAVKEEQALPPGVRLLDEMDIIAQELVLSIRARLGGQQALMAKAMANIPHIGDCWIMATERVNTVTGERDIEYEALSISELFEEQLQDGKSARSLMRQRLPNKKAEKVCDLDENGQPKPIENLAEGTITTHSVVRIWEPDHRYSDMAYSSLKAVRNTLRVIRLCDLALAAMLDARAHLHGMLLWPDDVSIGGRQTVVVTDDDEVTTTAVVDQDSFLDDLVREASERQQNHGSPQSLFPMVVPMPSNRISESNGGPRLLDWAGKFEATIADLRDASVTRLAQQTDLPVSVVTGETGNRWSDFVVKQTLFQAHLAPKFEMIVSAITEQLFVGLLAGEFRRELNMSEEMALEKASEYCVWYDAQALIVNPDRTADADAAYDRFAISQSSYLRAKGFDENDMPSLEELQRAIALSVVKAAPTIGAKLLPLIGLPALDPNSKGYNKDIAEALQRFGESASTVTAGQVLSGELPSTPTGSPPTTVTPVTGPPTSAAAGIVRASVHTALASAGTYLLNAANSKKGEPHEATLLKATPAHLRVHALGLQRATELGFSVENLRFDALDLLELDVRTRAGYEVYARTLAQTAIATGEIPQVG